MSLKDFLRKIKATDQNFNTIFLSDWVESLPFLARHTLRISEGLYSPYNSERDIGGLNLILESSNHKFKAYISPKTNILWIAIMIHYNIFDLGNEKSFAFELFKKSYFWEANMYNQVIVMIGDPRVVLASPVNMNNLLAAYRLAQSNRTFYRDNPTFFVPWPSIEKESEETALIQYVECINTKTLRIDQCMAFFLRQPKLTKSILLGLAVTIVLIAATMTCGLNLLPSAAITVSSGALAGGASFFALKSSDDKQDEIITENLNQNATEI